MFGRRIALAVGVLAGCGRIDFEQLDDAAAVDLRPWPTLDARWTWVDGDQLGFARGRYGTKGVSSPTNVPGSRDNGASWMLGGALWIFGGSGYAEPAFGELNDVWRYEPTRGEWTWIAGSNARNQVGTYGTRGQPAAINTPGGRNDSAAWIGPAGDVWLFGGSGTGSVAGSGKLGDLWRFDGQTWTWINGFATIDARAVHGPLGIPTATAMPGGRSNSASWSTAEGFWLYGGGGFDSTATGGALAELWRYEPMTNEWTWMTGPTLADAPPVRGTQGIADPANTPGGRLASCAWTTPGALWLFGGGRSELYSDLWRYTIEDGAWTWISGPSAPDQPGVYGVRGVPDRENSPGARAYQGCTQDPRGNFWMFGGLGVDRTGTMGSLSDAWVYQPALQEWTWVAGDDLVDLGGRYGVLGSPDPANTPGARRPATMWAPDDGSLWLFGGDYGFDAQSTACQLNDVWRLAAP